MLNTREISETIRMIDEQNLDIRTITMGISLLDCADPDPKAACQKVYDKICKKAEHLVATGKITPQQALTHPNRNVLLASLGGQDEPKVSLDEVTELHSGDAFVLCSDGLWGYFDDLELGTLVADNTARQACEILIDKARQRAKGSGDNLSLAIIKLIEALPPKKHGNIPL